METFCSATKGKHRSGIFQAANSPNLALARGQHWEEGSVSWRDRIVVFCTSTDIPRPSRVGPVLPDSQPDTKSLTEGTEQVGGGFLPSHHIFIKVLTFINIAMPALKNDQLPKNNVSSNFSKRRYTWKGKISAGQEAAKCNESLRFFRNQTELETDYPKLQLILTLAVGPLSALPFGASPSSSLAGRSRW